MTEKNEEINYWKNLFKFFNKKHGREKCAYCGRFATDREHVIPKSWIESTKEMKSLGFDIKIPKEIIVPSCRECNSIASQKIFDNFSKKKIHIRNELKNKYNKFMDKKIWTDEELENLSGHLKHQIILYNETLKSIKNWYKSL